MEASPSMLFAGFLAATLGLAVLVSIGLRIARVSVPFLGCLAAAAVSLGAADVVHALTHALVAAPDSAVHHLSSVVWGVSLVVVVRRFTTKPTSAGRVAVGAIAPVVFLSITLVVIAVVGFLIELAPKLVYKGF